MTDINDDTRYLSETLVTDTIVYEIVGRTAKTLTLRKMRHGDLARKVNHGGNPYPCVWEYAVPGDGPTITVRLRKDGTYRTGQGGRPLRPATKIDGRPVIYTDYRM